MKERDLSFDVLKGILMLLVVLGHAYSYEYGNIDCWREHPFNFIYTFHMPLFVMVSGYFFHSCLKRNLVDNVKNKIKRLVVPWLIISIITTIIFFTSKEYVELGSIGLVSLATKVYTIFLSLWFLPCIYCLTFFYYFIAKIKTSIVHRIIGEGLILMFCALLVYLSFFEYSSNILLSFVTHCQIVRQTLIFGIGILLYQYKDKINIRTWVFIDIVSIIGIVVNRIYFGIWIAEYSFLQRIIDGICCSILLFSFLKPFCLWLSRFKVSKIFTYCGINSLGIYCIHHIIYYLFDWNCLLPKEHTHISSILFFLGLTMVTVLFIEIIKRIFRSKSYIFGV